MDSNLKDSCFSCLATCMLQKVQVKSYGKSTKDTFTPIRLCGLPVVLASVGRVMRIGRWSQPRWEVTVELVVLIHVTINPSKLFMSEVLMLMVS